MPAALDSLELSRQAERIVAAAPKLLAVSSVDEQAVVSDEIADVAPGTSFEAIVRRAVGRGLIHEARDDPERYLRQRLAQHRNPAPRPCSSAPMAAGF